MASIDELIAGGAKTNANFDFGSLNKSYWEGLDQAYKRRTQDAFQDPALRDANGNIDLNKAIQKSLEVGGLPGVEQAKGLSGIDLQQQQIQTGQRQAPLIQQYEGGDSSPARPVVSPSLNRSAAEPAAPDLTQGRTATAPQPQGGSTVADILTANGIPNSEIGNVARSLNVDPARPVGLQDPLRQPLIAAIGQFKNSGIGQTFRPGEAVPAPQAVQPINPQVAQASPIVGRNAPSPLDAAQWPQGPVGAQTASGGPQPPQDTSAQSRQPQPAPITDPSTSTARTAPPSRIDQGIALYSGILNNPNSPANQVALAKERLQALQKANETTPTQKEYIQARLEGFKGTMQDFVTEQESGKAAATEQGKAYVTKYNNIDEAGTKAIQEIPKLQVALKLMDDPNYYSGAGEKYNLLAKRVAVALGGDPDKAAPQEIVGKITADSILNGLGSLKGLGPIRVAEMNLARTAAMSPDNSIQANKFLAQVALRVQQRAVQVSDMAQNYNDGKLDAGYDRNVRAFDKANPLFSPAEVARFQNIIDGKEKAQTGPQKFNSPSDVAAAVKAKTLNSGDTFLDSRGTLRTVP